MHLAKFMMTPIKKKNRLKKLGLIVSIFFCYFHTSAAEEIAEQKLATQLESLNEYITDAEAQKRFSGLSITIIHDQDIIYQRQEGYQNYTDKTPITKDTSRFLIGSISKTMTGVAIAQLLEQGKIKSLEDPVNPYLKRLKLEGKWGDRVTFNHLLSHTAGFEAKNTGLASYENFTLPLTAEDLKFYKADIVREPGKYMAYSNYGIGILGLVIEDISGISVAEYFRKNIFQPLGMTSTEMLTNPVRPDDQVIAYRMSNTEQPQEIPWLPFHPLTGPIGGVSATPADMVKYISFHLNAYQGQSPGVLSAEMIKQMHRPIAGNHEDTKQFSMLFNHGKWRDQTVIWHTGSWPPNYSMMWFLPELNIGGYIGVTGAAKNALKPAELWKYIMREMYGAFRENTFATPKKYDLSEYVGDYLSIQQSHSKIDAFLSLFSAKTTRVNVGENQDLVINGKADFKPIGKDLFYSENFFPGMEGTFYAFSRDKNSNDVNRLTGYFQSDTRLKVSWWQTPQFIRSLLYVCLFILCSSILTVLIRKPKRKLSLIARSGVSVSCAALVLMIDHITSDTNLLTIILANVQSTWYQLAFATNLVFIFCLLLLFDMLKNRSEFKHNHQVIHILLNVHNVLVALSAVFVLYILFTYSAVGWKIP